MLVQLHSLGTDAVRVNVVDLRPASARVRRDSRRSTAPYLRGSNTRKLVPAPSSVYTSTRTLALVRVHLHEASPGVNACNETLFGSLKGRATSWATLQDPAPRQRRSLRVGPFGATNLDCTRRWSMSARRASSKTGLRLRPCKPIRDSAMGYGSQGLCRVSLGSLHNPWDKGLILEDSSVHRAACLGHPTDSLHQPCLWMDSLHQQWSLRYITNAIGLKAQFYNDL